MYIMDTLGERLTKGCDKAYLLKFNEESITHNVEPKTKIPKAESEGLDMIRVLLLIREKHKKENNSGIVCKGTSCCKEIIKGILTTIPLGELQSKVERGINGDMPLHQLLQIEFHYVSPLQQKLFGPSVVVLLKGHCKQRISNTRRAREHLDVLQESEEARISNDVDANQKMIKKDLEKQHVLRQKVDSLLNQNH
nr:hypothetical protein [Tanacetum cinerariifolium]